jgi:cytoskeleton protein RodZ
MQFGEAAWVQIRDSSGRVVHSGMNPAGSSVEVNGKAPFYLVVGNAEHVSVNYKGQLVDLKPFTAVNVARLTLNQ